MDLYNIEVEQIVLGALLTRNNNLQKIIFLEDKHFYEPLHQEMFRIIRTQILDDNELNPFTLDVILKGNEAYQKLDGKTYLHNISAQGGTIVGLAPYGEIIRSLHDKRALKNVIDRELANIEKKDAVEIVEAINKEVSDLHITNSAYKITTFENTLDEMVDRAQREKEFTSTGFDRIDLSMNGGLERKRTYCFAAPPKHGKTMFKGTIANHIRKQDKRFLFIAAEMGSIEIVQRMVAADIDEAANDLYSIKKKPNIANKLAKYKSGKMGSMLFNDSPRISLDVLRSVVAKAVKTKKIEGVVLDYLQLVTGKGSSETIAQHQENVAQTLAEIAKKYDIWVLYSAQVNREGTIRNGSGIEMAADWVYEISKTEKYHQDDPDKFYLKYVAGRATKAVDIGTQDDPSYNMSPKGTHIIEIKAPNQREI